MLNLLIFSVSASFAGFSIYVITKTVAKMSVKSGVVELLKKDLTKTLILSIVLRLGGTAGIAMYFLLTLCKV